jgi:hypothetical protein
MSLDKERFKRVLTPQQSTIILNVSSMEPILMEEEVLVLKELLCYTAPLRTLEMLLFSLETLKELLLEND